jgi:hypothetical protein
LVKAILSRSASSLTALLALTLFIPTRRKE